MIAFKLCPGGECPLRNKCVRHLEYVRKETDGRNEPAQVLREPPYVNETGHCHYEMPAPVTTTSGDRVEYPMPEPEALTSVE